jgi:hypothetical protein
MLYNTLREEHSLRVLENRMLRKRIGLMRKVTTEARATRMIRYAVFFTKYCFVELNEEC